MSQSGEDKGSPTDFDDFDGEIELDGPAKIAPQAPQPADQEQPAPRQSLAGHPSRDRSQPAPGRPLDRLVIPDDGRRRWAKPLVWLIIGGCGLLAGRYAFSRYEVAQRRYQFSQSAKGLRQALLRMGQRVQAEDVRAVVEKLAAEAKVVVNAIHPSIEPLTPASVTKLPQVAQTSIGMAAQFKNHSIPVAIVGFKAELVAEHGMAKLEFTEERYTWFEQPLGEGDAARDAARQGIRESFQDRLREQLKDSVRRELP